MRHGVVVSVDEAASTAVVTLDGVNVTAYCLNGTAAVGSVGVLLQEGRRLVLMGAQVSVPQLLGGSKSTHDLPLGQELTAQELADIQDGSESTYVRVYGFHNVLSGFHQPAIELYPSLNGTDTLDTPPGGTLDVSMRVRAASSDDDWMLYSPWADTAVDNITIGTDWSTITASFHHTSGGWSWQVTWQLSLNDGFLLSSDVEWLDVADVTWTWTPD